MNEPKSVEQMCRDLLTQALKDSLVSKSRYWSDGDPQARSAGEIVGMANMLADCLRQEHKAVNDRWEKAIGHSLETAEALASSLR